MRFNNYCLADITWILRLLEEEKVKDNDGIIEKKLDRIQKATQNLAYSNS
jgi:hypothetical protein